MLSFRIIIMFTTTLLQMSGKKAITQSQKLWAPKENKTIKKTHIAFPTVFNKSAESVFHLVSFKQESAA